MSATVSPLTYGECRARFRHAAAAAGARVAARPLVATGPGGTELTIDVAALGAAEAERMLVVLSGVHGVEGFLGSAIQCDLLEAPPALPPRTAVVLVHAVNPWGMAWQRRQNEHNVDLNRNWARSETAFAANEPYELLHPLLCPSDLGDRDEFLSAMGRWVAERGMGWVAGAITYGQDTHPDGMHFAGTATEESNVLLPALLAEFVGATAREVFVVDLHTGEGAPGDVALLAGGPAETPNCQWLQGVFGADAVKPTDGRTPGRIAAGLAERWPHATHRFTTVEFGTVDAVHQLLTARAELWWHTKGRPTEPEAVAAREAYRQSFTPDDPAWMETARHHGALLVRASLAAIAPPASGLDWLGARGRDGGIDTVPLPPGIPGGLSLCGKHAVGPDHAAALARCGATTIVCLVESHELDDRYPEYATWLRGAAGGPEALWYPIHDLHAPTVELADAMLDELQARLQRGDHLLLHCAAGIGRTGTIAACLLIRLGMSEEAALAHVADNRPMAGPEVGAQRDLVAAIAGLAAR